MFKQLSRWVSPKDEIEHWEERQWERGRNKGTTQEAEKRERKNTSK
jgi:hypothetical protein